MLDSVGGIHSVRIKKGSNKSKDLTVKMLYGPSGRRDRVECGAKDYCPNIFPRSRAQFEDFISEQENLLHRVVTSKGVSKKKQEKFGSYMVTLKTFRKKFNKL